MKIIWLDPIIPGPIISRTVPCVEENVAVSFEAFSISSKRLSAQKSKRSLRYTGVSVRMRFQVGCGLSSISLSYGSQ